MDWKCFLLWLAFKVARSGDGSVVFAQRIVQFDSGPLSGGEFSRAQVAQDAGFRSLAGRDDDTVV